MMMHWTSGKLMSLGDLKIKKGWINTTIKSTYQSSIHDIFTILKN